MLVDFIAMYSPLLPACPGLMGWALQSPAASTLRESPQRLAENNNKDDAGVGRVWYCVFIVLVANLVLDGTNCHISRDAGDGDNTRLDL